MARKTRRIEMRSVELAEIVCTLGWPVATISRVAGIPCRTLRDCIDGKRSISPENAIKLRTLAECDFAITNSVLNKIRAMIARDYPMGIKSEKGEEDGEM